MAKCWTCGSVVEGYHYTCTHCQSLKELKDLQNKVQSYSESLKTYSEQLLYLQQVQQEGFNSLKTAISTGLSQIASCIEWGFGELIWQVHQQTDVLLSIDHSLKTPSETQANEWRKMAEELRRRGVLDESEEFYLKALDLNRLDYRIYVGLAKTFLQMNKFDKAKTYLEKSLPHAPKREIDYKSYSYRLIGHIYSCEDDNNSAVAILKSAIELSPEYHEAYYDYAQYLAQLKKEDQSLESLIKAIRVNNLYFYLAQVEKNFDPIKNRVGNLLIKIKTEALDDVKRLCAKADADLQTAKEMIGRAEIAKKKAKISTSLDSKNRYDKTLAKLSQVNNGIASEDYATILDVKPIAEEAVELVRKAINAAKYEYEEYRLERAEKVRNAWKLGMESFIVTPIYWGFIGLVGGWVISLFSSEDTSSLILGGLIVGVILGFIFGIRIFYEERT